MPKKNPPPVVTSVTMTIGATGRYAVVRTTTGKHEFRLPDNGPPADGLRARAAEVAKLAADWQAQSELLAAAVAKLQEAPQ